jgi:uncharacterized protein YyaL (SSP411 family)
MERESFENEATAGILNDHFISIKVDREERPDVDKVYMTALQAMGENGGWPLSMFLTPELKPFFGGTYFPPRSQYGRIGFPDLLLRISDVWANQREKILQSADGIIDALKSQRPIERAGLLEPSLFDTCFAQFERSYDPTFGGFGQGPKFPRPSVYSFLMRHEARTANPKALEMVEKTLEAMARGGMYDHIGGGFHRYSVDAEWRVPHFEKMLYDQAQIVVAYIEAYQRTRADRYAGTANDVLQYVLRDMTHPDGGFYSAEDADSALPDSPSEKGEGAFYVWTKREIVSLLETKSSEIFCHHYGVLETGNVSVDPHQEFIGKNILHAAYSIDETARTFGMQPGEVDTLLRKARATLLEVRLKRPRPLLDDKVICSWNGLMIGAFARASQVLGRGEYCRVAERAARFVLERMYNENTGLLVRRYRDGVAGLEAHLDDYAFLVQGLLDLFEATSQFHWLDVAVRLTEKQIALFQDEVRGGFYDTSGADPSVLVRMKEQYDGAEPTGNSVAALNLIRLADVTGKTEYRDRAEQTLNAFGALLQKQPIVMPQMVATCDAFMSSHKQIIIAGKREDSTVQRMLAEVHARFIPNKSVLVLDGGENQTQLATLDQFYSSIVRHSGKSTAYICENRVCRLPVTEPEDVAALLGR